MIELFKIAEGPWELLFEGRFQEHEVQIYSNPESLVLAVIFEKEKEKIAGAVVELYKIYYAIGELESFAETLPKELIVLTKHDEKETLKFFILSSTPTFLEWKEKEFIEGVDSLVKKLNTSSKLVKDVSKAYDLKLLEFKKAPDNARRAFFSQPLLVPLVSTASHGLPEVEREKFKVVPGEMILGITKEGNNIVEESLNLFLKTLVLEGSEIERRFVMQVLIESALLSNSTAVVLDFKNEFAGLGIATKTPEKFKEFKIDIEPVGFPVKAFKALEDLQVNLSMINPQGLIELFGLGNNVEARILIQAMMEKSFDSIAEVIENVKKIELSDEVTAYRRDKAIRALNLMQFRYPKLFNGKNNIEEVSKSWVRALGRAGIIDMQGLDYRQSLLLLCGFVKEMLEFYKKQGTSKKVKSMIFIPEIQEIFKEENIVSKESVEALNQFKDYGIGFVASAPSEIDVEMQLKTRVEALIGIVSRNDVGIKIQNRKQYRVLLRPTLSEFKD